MVTEVLIDELQGMDTDSVSLNWMFYKTQEVGGFEYNWTEYLNTFEDGEGWESTPLYLESSQGQIRATSTCFDLWPSTQPIPEDMDNVIVKFWLTGYDSSGQTIGGAGSFGTSVNSGAGTYELAYESAQFTISRVDMSVDKPMAQTDFDLLIDFQNDGNKEGVLEIQIVTWIGDEASSPVTYTCPFSVQPGEDTRWRISMDQFPNAAINVLPAAQAVEPMRSRGPPATRAGDRRGPPGASRGPPAAAKSPMDIAKEKFPFWDEATIQGYFDQGWNVEQLEEWLASQE